MDELPPPLIAAAKLIQFAEAGPPVVFTGSQSVYVGGELIGPVPLLAICQQLSDLEFDLYLCDEHWNIIAAVSGDSVSSLTSRAERWYRGISTKWINSPYSDAEFEEFLNVERGDMRCSFCRRWDWEYLTLFSGDVCNICDICVRDFWKKLAPPSEE